MLRLLVTPGHALGLLQVERAQHSNALNAHPRLAVSIQS